jgi:predicted nuclease of restriction endonuclease-like (RecB) superfamily
MRLSDEQIKKLLDWFVNSSETRKTYAEQRIKSQEENHKWIQPEVITKISDQELEEKFLEYYKSGGGRQNLNQIYRDRIIRDKKRFREMTKYLLDEKVSVQKRLDEILEAKGNYHIEGVGKAIATSFLMDFNPNKYCLWNNKTEMGFSTLGWKVYENKDSWGEAYSKVLEVLQKLMNLRPEYNLVFEDIDLFLHTISAEEEGQNAVNALTEGAEIPRPIARVAEQIPKVTEIPEFAMEKYLEEFIEANFNKINFGAKLELYQDEESTGRQYHTSIGDIDLLAVDREKREFVVIELKKGRGSDAVVGQILRYMGWVKENLAKDGGVRGIIIVKDRDERLEYALKLMPNISLFSYTVSFDLRKII